MLPDWASNPGPLTYESGALPIALRGQAETTPSFSFCIPAQVPKKNNFVVLGKNSLLLGRPLF